MAVSEDVQDAAGHVLTELGFGVERAGDELHGSAPIVPEMHVPGTDVLRLSLLASWADMITGLLAADVVGPRVPVTLDLDVHLTAPPHDLGWVHVRGRVARPDRRGCANRWPSAWGSSVATTARSCCPARRTASTRRAP